MTPLVYQPVEFSVSASIDGGEWRKLTQEEFALLCSGNNASGIIVEHFRGTHLAEGEEMTIRLRYDDRPSDWFFGIKDDPAL